MKTEQQQLQIGRRALQAPVRVVRVDDRAVIDPLRPVRRAERAAVERVSQEDRAALRSGLLGRRRLAAHLGVSKDIVQRVWREADLRPHRLARYMTSTE